MNESIDMKWNQQTNNLVTGLVVENTNEKYQHF